MLSFAQQRHYRARTASMSAYSSILSESNIYLSDCISNASHRSVTRFASLQFYGACIGTIRQGHGKQYLSPCLL